MPDPRPRELHLTQLIPNLMTISAMCAGLTGIRFAVSGNFTWAVAMILLAAVLDGLDGRVARLLKSESEIGAELDSLVDFVNFGVATGIVVYLWGLDGQQPGGWIATLIYASCCMLRLARFNIGNRVEKADGEEKSATFTGVPAPAGAMLALLPMYVAFIWPEARLHPVFLVLWLLLVGGLMISRIPTPSFKSVTILAENVRFVVVGFVAMVAALFSFPWHTMLAIDLVYIAIVLQCLWQFRKNRRGLRGL